MRFIYIFFLLNFPYAVTPSCNEHSGELHFVAVVYRHGDRAPVQPYPKDPHYSESCWPNGWGQLTNLGKLQQFELGRWLRNRYCKFLPMNYSPNDIYVVSSDADRTLVSAYSNLAGLYETWMKENKVKQLEWIAIPVHSVPKETDGLIGMCKRCPAYERLREKAFRSEEVEVVNEYYSEIFEALSGHTGLDIRSVTDVPQLYQTLNIEYMHGLQLPSWTKNYFPDAMREMSEFASRLPCLTIGMKRLRCGPLLKDILKRIEDRKDGVARQKMWMYSGHDSTISNLMMCLNVHDGILPPYNAMLIFELFKKYNEWWVMLSYKTSTKIEILRIPRCERLCSLINFKKLIKPVIPVNWQTECSVTEEQE